MVSNMVLCLIKSGAKLQKNMQICKKKMTLNVFFNTLNDLFNAVYEISSTFAADFKSNTIQPFIT